MRDRRGPANDLAFMPLTALSNMLAQGTVSPVELVDAYLERIDRFNDSLRSYITICRDAAREAARQVEAEIREGHHRGPLHGLPIAHKDISLTKHEFW
jgi:aspartyl-tRNA(Asn)/glutamyl-tRNA(Gln) amidotransferase subunit A